MVGSRFTDGVDAEDAIEITDVKGSAGVSINSRHGFETLGGIEHPLAENLSEDAKLLQSTYPGAEEIPYGLTDLRNTVL